MKRILILAPLACLLGLLLSGCRVTSTTDLYKLPRISNDYVNLESKTKEVLSLGAEYCAPLAGSNRQSVQLLDLDYDGVEEAIAFFKLEDEAKPLRVYIFRLIEGAYTTAAIIEAEGNAFDTIEYAQLDGEGCLELLIGTSLNSETPQVMNVYAINDFVPVLLGQITYTDCYAVCDMDQDQKMELLTAAFNASAKTGIMYLYKYAEGSMENVSQVQLSSGIEKLYSIRTGYLSDKVQAVYLTSVYNGYGRITDIIALKREKLRNITYDYTTERSTGTIVNSPISLEDINGDHVLEIPRPEVVNEVHGGTALESCYMITWMAYASTGRSVEAVVTFHNLSEGWYIDVTDKWEKGISISRYYSANGTRSTTFFTMKESGILNEIMRIYVLTGDNRYSRVNTTGSFHLKVQDVTVYAARISDTQGLPEAKAKEVLAQRFHLTRSDWITGVIA